MAVDDATIDEAVQNTLSRLEPLLQRTEEDPRPVILMTCGVSGAGKTTLSRALLARHPTFTRLSMDAIIASRHGLYGQDYDPSKLEEYQDEADTVFRDSLANLLKEGKHDIVLDRAFYDKGDRDEFKGIVEVAGGRVVLVYLNVEREELWRRIGERRVRGVDADSCREISWELLGEFVEGLDVPSGEGEIVIDST